MRSSRHWPRTGLAIVCMAVLIVSWWSVPWGSTVPSARADDSTTATVLVDLGDPATVGAWTTVNDPVMGGRSTSTVAFGEGGLVFSGTISLDNNGGFASARGPVDPEIGARAAGATSLRVRALGDGKTYVFKVDTGQPWSYLQRFSTEAGLQRTYDLPVGNFQSVGRFLDPVPGVPALDPSTISRVAFYILDKQEGPFQLIVSGIDTSG